MVNTFNIERKPKMIDKDKATWIPIGESRKQTYTFKELNGESTKQVENKPDITKAQF